MADENTSDGAASVEATVETGQTEDQGGDDLVPLSEATDEELDAFLSAPSEPAPAVEEAPQPAKEEQPAPEQPKEEPKAQIPSVEEWKQGFQTQLGVLKQRSTEIEGRRSENQRVIAQLRAQAEEVAAHDPREAAKIDRAIEAAQAEERRMQAELGKVSNLSEAMALIPKHLSPQEFDPEAIRQELVEDGMPKHFIDMFMQDMLSAAYPETIVHLAKRAFRSKILRQIVPEAIRLKKENAQLRAQLSGKGEQVVRGIQNALKSTSTLTAKTSASNSPGTSPNTNPSTWSDAELEAFLTKRA